MKRHAPAGLPNGDPYPAVGIQRALESAIGLPSRATSASWMLVFVMPADVSRSFMPPPGLPLDLVLGTDAPRPRTHRSLPRLGQGRELPRRGRGRTRTVAPVVALSRGG